MKQRFLHAEPLLTAGLAGAAFVTLMALPAFAADAPPVPNKGDTAWMLIASALVLMMTVPGLALFYGGLVRTKNMLSVLMQVMYTVCIVAIIWVTYGYSLAFTGGGGLNSYIGGLSKLFLLGITQDSNVETFSKGVVIPEFVYICFQMTFACITPALIVGSLAERIKFSAVALFIPLWVTFVYFPIAHMVWFWGGPSAAADPAGLAFTLGAIDYAGGTVVHINAGIAGFVGALLIGKRIGYGRDAMPPHSLVMTLIGSGLLWVGWFGFNAGSALEANGNATLAMLNTFVATAAAGLSWLSAEWIFKGKASLLGAVSGAVAGLVAITPAAGFAGPMGAVVMGLAVGPLCLFFCSTVKNMFGYDDALDVFGVHCIGGIFGALATGIVVNPALGGTGVWDYAAGKVAAYSLSAQMTSQVEGVLITLLWSGIGSFVLYKFVDLLIGLRVNTDGEREGLDLVDHGERAYTL